MLGAPSPRGSASILADPRHCLGTREVNAFESLAWQGAKDGMSAPRMSENISQRINCLLD
jgi:hypothetical protein